MLLILPISVLFLIPFSFGDQCPSSNYCTCSLDLTIVICANHQLTDESLIKLNSQLPKTATVLNLSSNSLTSIHSLSNFNHLQTLDLSFNKIQSLPFNFLSKFPQISSLYLQNNSLKTIPKTFHQLSNINLDLSNNPLNCTCQFIWILKWFKTIHLLNNRICQNNKRLNKNDFCPIRNSLQIIPSSQSQFLYENEQFVLNCSSNSQLSWTLNKKPYQSIIPSSFHSTIIIPHLQLNHSGLWTCHTRTSNRSISLTVLKFPVNHFCQSIQMNTSKGYFYWSRSLINKKLEIKCPFGSAAWFTNSSEYARAWHTCSSKGQWIDFDLSQCAFRTNISRMFDHLSFNETNFLVRLVKYLSKIDLNLMQFDDIILLVDLIDDQHDKYQTPEKIMLIYHLTDFILQIKHDSPFLYEYRMAITRLRFILQRLLNLTNQSWLYIGKELTAMTIKSPLSSTICSIPNRSLLTIICEIDNKHHESQLATIQFLSHTHTNDNQSSLFRIIFYRQSILFTSDENISNHNPAVYIQPVSTGNLSRIKLTFYGQLNQASIGIRSLNQTSWQMSSSICEINKQNIDLISTNCLLLNNNSFSITYFNHHIENKTLIFVKNYSQLAIYVSSTIASICLLMSILFYICCYKIYLMPRCFFHCLINYWLSLGILFPLFAFGIRLNQYPFLCPFIAISLHYLCLTTILWLTLLTYSIWRKLNVLWTDKDHHGKTSLMIIDYDNHGLPIVELKSKPVIQFYFVAYGIAFIICSINVLISREQYIANKICFLNDFDSLLTLFIPIMICIFLLFLFLLAARMNLKRLTNETIHSRYLPDESEVNREINLIHEENVLSSKRKETSLNLNYHQSHLDSLYSSDVDHQHQPINQLLSILFQLILLIFLFLSSFTIYLHPLHSFNLRFEHIIYSHFYGFFVLLLAFYILSFYVLSRSNLITHHYFHRKNSNHQSYIESPPPSIHSMINKENDDSFTEQQLHSHYSSNIHKCGEGQNDIYIYGSKRQTNITSKYNTHHQDIFKIHETSLQQNSLSDTFPLSSLNTLSQDSINEQQSQRNSLYERSPKRSMNNSRESYIIQNKHTQFYLPSIISSRSFIRPRASASQATIRSLPNTHKNLSSSINPASTDSCINSLIKKTNPIIEGKLSVWKKPPHGHPSHVAYIDEDDECSVSLKSSIYDSKISSNTTSSILTKNDRSQSLSSSSSNEFYNAAFDKNHITLYESSV